MPKVAEKIPPFKTQTVGHAVDEDGNSLHDDLRMVSGQTNWIDAGEGVHLPENVDPRVLDHVEGQTAALMRRRGAPQDAAVFLNKDPCPSTGSWVGCLEVLPGVLPSGSRLTIYKTENGKMTHGEDGRPKRWVVEGTGEWLT